MTQKQRKALEGAYVEIENEEAVCICYTWSMMRNKVCLLDIKEAMALNPNSMFWWGMETMDLNIGHPEVRSARLLGIAFMLTMPKDMIP
jgi:hypothetical protein